MTLHAESLWKAWRNWMLGFATIGLATGNGFCAIVAPLNTFEEEKIVAIEQALERAVLDRQTPGAVLWFERNGFFYRKAIGERAVLPEAETMTDDTIFDAASLTKVVATAPGIMLLVQRGLIDVDAPVHKYVEEFRRNGRESITIRQLLTHTSGLRPGLSAKPDGAASAIAIACEEETTSLPGTSFRYSDINFILLGEIVRRVSGQPLEEFVTREVFRPLGMNDTGFLPKAQYFRRVAPTELSGTNFLRGMVHDPTARRMGGVAGHAGLFTTAADLARFARMMLNYGKLDSIEIFRADIVAAMTTIQSPANVSSKRGFGWDIESAYSRPRGDVFPLGSYGHTGFTGTSLWIDPTSRSFWILLTNRVHPNGKGNILPTQKLLGSLVAEAMRVGTFERTPPAIQSKSSQPAGR
jgi:CubicO group peptidase (beta-lactamase class C family)